MKKIISILLSLILVLTFAACGTANTNSTPSDTEISKLDAKCNIYALRVLQVLVWFL